MKIIKRNGTEVPYDYRKIQRAMQLRSMAPVRRNEEWQKKLIS